MTALFVCDTFSIQYCKAQFANLDIVLIWIYGYEHVRKINQYYIRIIIFVMLQNGLEIKTIERSPGVHKLHFLKII